MIVKVVIKMEVEISKLKIDKITDTCPVCNYNDGFHVSFKKGENKLNIILICPDCHSRFDPHWEI